MVDFIYIYFTTIKNLNREGKGREGQKDRGGERERERDMG